MAKKVILVDDIDGTVLEDGKGETIEFSLYGDHFTIDLSDANAKKLETDFKKWIDHATTVEAPRRAYTSSTKRSTRAPSGSGRSKEELAAIRSWATTQGIEVSSRGRVSQEIQDKFDAAHAPTPAQ